MSQINVTKVQEKNHKSIKVSNSKTISNVFDPITQGVPVDYTFNGLDSYESVDLVRPRSTRLGTPPTRGPNNRFCTGALWLNHNKFTTLKNMHKLAEHLLEQPYSLTWIDFSFNRIKCIHDDLLKFQNIRVLYLHGNNIECIAEVSKLRRLKKLCNLTLQGNPVENINHFRSNIVNMLPQISNLNFSSVTIFEREAVLPTNASKLLRV